MLIVRQTLICLAVFHLNAVALLASAIHVQDSPKHFLPSTPEGLWKFSPQHSIYHFEFDRRDEDNQVVNGTFSPMTRSGDSKRPEQRSLQLDGSSSIAYGISSDTDGFSENFTWEGFFYSPASNILLTETGIGDRLVSQFANDAGDWTRLAIGLVSAKDHSARLAVELEGFDGRSFGLGKHIALPNQWHHFALVHEGTASAARIRYYLDYHLTGELYLGGQSDQNTLKPPGDAPFTFGARLIRKNEVNRGFKGHIDDIRLIPQPLSPKDFLNSEWIAKRTPPLPSPESKFSIPKAFWEDRHQWARKHAMAWMKIEDGQKDVNSIDTVIRDSAESLQRDLCDDATFVRRLSLDLRGRIPSLTETRDFIASDASNKREQLIDRFIASDEWADSWVGYWQDVLAENPSLVFPTLNNSGPFRQWIYDCFQDNMPFDQFATTLVLMDGDEEGAAGFALATQNDVPMAMKAHVLVQAFLGVDLKCARCHDSPIEAYTQRELFQLAALLHDGPLEVPKTSLAASSTTINGREAQVTTSLSPGERVAPNWPPRIGEPESDRDDKDLMPIHSVRPRAEFAANLTSPMNSRFSDVVVNRIWKRFMGEALANPVQNWDSTADPSSKQLMRHLSSYFIESGYDVKALTHLIVSSECYQGTATGSGKTPSWANQSHRPLTSEQLVDSLFAAAGKQFESETLALHATDPGAVNLPKPERAWQMLALPNERDRPALGMPVNQTIVDTMRAFGWEGARQLPRSSRDTEASPIQPLIMFNSLLSQRIVRLSDNSSLTTLCIQAGSLDQLIDDMFVTVLSRNATNSETRSFSELLRSSYKTRLTGKPPKELPPLTTFQADWRKHLEPEQTLLLIKAEKRVARGEPATEQLTPEFREAAEDAIWALFNSPEFRFIP